MSLRPLQHGLNGMLPDLSAIVSALF